MAIGPLLARFRGSVRVGPGRPGKRAQTYQRLSRSGPWSSGWTDGGG